VRRAVDLPVFAAGGIADAGDVTAALHAGALATLVGTLLLRSDESGLSTTHQAALVDKQDVATTLTRAFTGRPARAIRNAFVDCYSDIAPLGYPALHHLTSALRKAAAAAGDQERVHLWAGTGHGAVRAASTEEILTDLAARA